MIFVESLELALFHAAERLGPVRDEVVFVGGAVRGLLVTDTGAAGGRPTDDVDVIVEVSALAGYHELESRLRRVGFKHDLRDDAPIWRTRGLETITRRPPITRRPSARPQRTGSPGCP